MIPFLILSILFIAACGCIGILHKHNITLATKCNQLTEACQRLMPNRQAGREGRRR